MHHFGDLCYTCIIVNKILPNFYADMRQIYLFSMVINREILRRFARIRFVVANLVAGPAQAFEKYFSQPLVLVPQHTHLPLARFTVQYRSETVYGNKRRRRTSLPETLHLLINGTVIRPVERACTQVLVGLVQVAIAWHENSIAILEECTWVHELSIAVNDESRVVMQHGCNSKTLCQPLGQRPGANIQRKVATPCKRIEAHVTQGLGESATGVVAHKQNGVLRQGIEHSERPGFFGR